MKSLESAYIFVTAACLTFSVLSAAILGKQSQLPAAMLVFVTIFAAIGWIVFFAR